MNFRFVFIFVSTGSATVVAFLVLYALARSGMLRRPGFIAGAFGVLYAAARTFSEFFREPDPRLEDLGRGLTMGMVLSAPMVVVGLGLIAVSLARKGNSR